MADDFVPVKVISQPDFVPAKILSAPVSVAERPFSSSVPLTTTPTFASSSGRNYGPDYNPEGVDITEASAAQARRNQQMNPATMRAQAQAETVPYSPTGEMPSLEQRAITEFASPIIDIVGGVPIRFASAISGKLGGPTTDIANARLAESLPPPQSYTEAVVGGLSGIAGEAASFVVPSIPGALAGKASEAATLLGKIGKMGPRMQRALGIGAGVAGFTAMDAASSAMKGDKSAGQAAAEVAQAGPHFVAAMAQAPFQISSELVDMLKDGDVKTTELTRLFDSMKPLAAVALAHKLGKERKDNGPAKAMQTPEGALVLSITQPEAAAKLAESPARVQGIPPMSRGDRIELGRMIREIRAQDQIKVAPDLATMLEGKKNAPSIEEVGPPVPPPEAKPVAQEAQVPVVTNTPGPATSDAPADAATGPVVKQPWEMSKAEYNNVRTSQRVLDEVILNTAGEPNAAKLRDKIKGEADYYRQQTVPINSIQTDGLEYLDPRGVYAKENAGKPTNPVVLAGDGEIIDGRHRVAYAMRRGEKEISALVPVKNKTQHKDLIATALREGKPVPPEVLKDYPDLKPSSGQAATGPVVNAGVPPFFRLKGITNDSRSGLDVGRLPTESTKTTAAPDSRNEPVGNPTTPAAREQAGVFDVGSVRPTGASSPWKNAKVEDEGRWYGSTVNVIPEFKYEEPYTGKITRVLNNGEVIEVQPDGADTSFRVRAERVKPIEIVDAGPKVEKAKPTEKQKPAEIFDAMKDPWRFAEILKAKGVGRGESWSRFVQAWGLRGTEMPMGAAEWYKIYDQAKAIPEPSSGQAAPPISPGESAPPAGLKPDNATPNPERTVIPSGKEEEGQGRQGLLSPSEAQPPQVDGGSPAVDSPDQNLIGLSLQENQRIRARQGLPPMDPVEARARVVSMNEAIRTGQKDAALDIAAAAITGQKPAFSEVTHDGMVLKMVELDQNIREMKAREREYRATGKDAAADLERVRINSTLEQINTLSIGTRMLRTETARTLGAGAVGINADTGQFVPAMQAARQANGDKPVPKETAKNIEKWTDEIAKRDAEIAELRKAQAEREAEVERRVAEAVAKQEKSKGKVARRTQAGKESILRERADIMKALAAKGFRLNSLVGVDPEGVHLIGKLAVNYIHEGAMTLDDVVKRVRERLPDLEERDVWQAMNARSPKAMAELTRATQSRVRELKTQARLLNEITALEGGEPLPGRPPKPITSAESKALRAKLKALRSVAQRSTEDAAKLQRATATIDALTENLKNGTREAKKTPSEPSEKLAAARAQIHDLRRTLRAEDDIADLQTQLDTGNIKMPEKRVAKPLSPLLREKLIQRDRLKNQVDAEIDRIQQKNDYEALSAKGKVFHHAKNLTDELRSIRATGDMSATLRQGLQLATSRPLAAGKAFLKAGEAMFRSKTAEEVMQNIKNSPTYELSQQAKLELTELDGPTSAREEFFRGKLLERVPGLGSVMRASNRHMTTYLNMLRMSAFDQFVKANPNATIPELTMWADYINKASGRGDLKSLGVVGSAMSKIFFAPKFSVSRFQTPATLYKYWSEPRVRKAIARDMAATVAVGSTALYLAYLAGAKVGLDPRDSDFGKMIIGNNHIDIWGGFQQAARLIVGSAAFATDIKRGIKNAGTERWDPISAVGRFLSYKLNPTITLAGEFLAERDIIGNKKPPSRLWEDVIPLVITDVKDAYNDKQDIMSAIGMGTLSGLGVGVGTYKKK